MIHTIWFWLYLRCHLILGFYGWGWHRNNLTEEDRKEISWPVKIFTAIISIITGPVSFLIVYIYINSKVWRYKLKSGFKFW